MRTLKVTLEIQCDSWDPEFDEDDDTPTTLEDYGADEVAEVFTGLNDQTSIELFAGSSVYATFKECRVLDAAWVEKQDR